MKIDLIPHLWLSASKLGLYALSLQLFIDFIDDRAQIRRKKDIGGLMVYRQTDRRERE